MPKGKRKGKHEHRRTEAANVSSDDESYNENGSEWSAHSDTRSVQEEDEDVNEEVLKNADHFEETLGAAVDGLNQKSAAGRVKCLQGAAGVLRARWAPISIAQHRLTLADHIEKCLKRGKSDEQAAAADLAALVAIQFGASDYCEELYNLLKPVLLTLALDNSVSAITRAKCVSALGLITFLAEDEIGNILEVMKNLESIFSGGYLKGDGSVKNNVTPEFEKLHSSALTSWALLLSLASPGDVYMMMGGSTTFAPSLTQLGGMLLSQGLEVRLGAGECLALAFQLGREHSENFGEDALPYLIQNMKELATDSHKYRAKKDRKTQRATFRDILRYLESEDLDDITVKIHNETLHIEGWCARRRYTELGSALGTGLHAHLRSSPALRAALLLPSPPIPDDNLNNLTTRTNNKLLRHLQNAANFKARTISRNKNRDKRSAVISY